jgi:hypothetical protein
MVLMVVVTPRFPSLVVLVVVSLMVVFNQFPVQSSQYPDLLLVTCHSSFVVRQCRNPCRAQLVLLLRSRRDALASLLRSMMRVVTVKMGIIIRALMIWRLVTPIIAHFFDQMWNICPDKCSFFRRSNSYDAQDNVVATAFSLVCAN